MSEQIKGMKDAVVGGRGGGLQEVSTAIGDTIGENTNTQSSSSKKADDASESIGDFAEGKKKPDATPGSADHLGLKK